jgi:hypothetical protein
MVLGNSTLVATPRGQLKRHFECVCDCGTVRNVYSQSLISGKSRSCGCLSRDEVRRPFGQAAATSLFATYRTKAKRQGKDFNLSEEQFLQLTQQDCYYCGSRPSNYLNSPKHYGGYVYNGIDRVDNTQGYIPENLVPCCKHCNLAKRTLTISEFISLVRKIYERHLIWEPQK